MNAINYSGLRQNLKKHMDEVHDNHEPLIITRKDQQNMVLMSLDDYNSLIETQYLLSTKNNAERLMNSLQNVRNGNLVSKELIKE